MFAAIQHQQKGPRGNRARDAFRGGTVIPHVEAENFSDGRRHQGGLGQGGQFDQPDLAPAKPGARRLAASTARGVLPIPPGPARVTTR